MSVLAVHDRSISVDDVAVAAREVGALGGVTSGAAAVVKVWSVEVEVLPCPSADTTAKW